MPMLDQLFWLLILSLVVASVSWTVTQEEIFKEPRDVAKRRSVSGANILVRKFFYVWTCEYCFSHWVTIGVLLLIPFRLIIDDWRGYFVSFFVLPWIANFWMSIYRLLRVDIKHENALAEKTIQENEESQPS